MAEFSEATWEIVRKLFSAEQQAAAAKMLETECGNNLPFLGKETSVGLERFRFAELKLSEGKLEKLRGPVDLAQTDWRLAYGRRLRLSGHAPA